MAIIPVGFAQINFRMTGFGVPYGAECVLGVEFGSFPAPTPSLIADDAADAWAVHIMPRMTADITLSEVSCKFGPNDTGPQGTVSRAVVGGVAQAGVTPNVAVLVRKNTAGGGRRNRGRMYVPGQPEAPLNANGDLTAPELNAWQVAFDGFYNALTTGALEPVVLHSPGISATPPPTGILGFSVQARVATQRDRLRP